MRSIILCSVFLFIAFTGIKAQNNRPENISSILKDIEENNTTLKALRLETESVILENKTNLTLADPEIGFNYLWGSPSLVGQRKDFSVTQSFDFTTLLGYKGSVAKKTKSYCRNRV